MSTDDDAQLKLCLQQALLTHITPELRSVSADIELNQQIIFLRFVFARLPSDSELDAASCAATEIIASYPDSWVVEVDYPIIPPGHRMQHHRLLVYHRCEDTWVGPNK